jgi:hypothetical protein
VKRPLPSSTMHLADAGVVGLVIRSPHRLPSGDVAVLERLMIHVLGPATEAVLPAQMICGQFCERQCSISSNRRGKSRELEDDIAGRPCL